MNSPLATGGPLPIANAQAAADPDSSGAVAVLHHPGDAGTTDAGRARVEWIWI